MDKQMEYVAPVVLVLLVIFFRALVYRATMFFHKVLKSVQIVNL